MRRDLFTPTASRRGRGSRADRVAVLRRLTVGRSRAKLVFLSGVFALGLVGVALAGPGGSILSGTGHDDKPGLIKAGPVSSEHGFPDWYRDSNGVELEPCLEPTDACAKPPIPDENKPVAFDANFPDEFFYQLDTATMTGSGGEDFLAEFAVEGAFASAVQQGDQMVFGRVRYRKDAGLKPGETYTVTHPFGTDKLQADDAGHVFVTQDVGVAPGDFKTVMTSRVGPFLTWDTYKDPDPAKRPPAGYVGDGVTPHAVAGSPTGNNFVRVEGPGVAGPNNPDSCKTTGADAWTPHDGLTAEDCIQTNLMTVVGKVSTKGGVEVARATYSTDAAGKAQLDVFAASKPGQNITVENGVPTTTLRNDAAAQGEDYFAHLDVTSVPKTVDVINHGDNPETVKHVTVTDQVTGTATYRNDGDTGGTLKITATSSDKAGSATLEAFGKPIPADGAIDMKAPPASVEVTSSKGGKATIPVVADGTGMGSAPPASEKHPPTVAPTLGASTGGQDKVTLAWEDVATTDASVDHYGVQLLNANGDNVGGLRSTPEQAGKAEQTLTIDNLLPGDYMFTVKAGNADGYGPESVRSAKLTVTVAADTLAITSARWRAGNEFRVVGTSSTSDPRVTVSIYPAVASGPNGTLVPDTTKGPIPGMKDQPLTAAVAPATGTTFDIRLRSGIPATNPGRVIAVSSIGGVSPAFTVRNG
jgi:hypothetical protein